MFWFEIPCIWWKPCHYWIGRLPLVPVIGAAESGFPGQSDRKVRYSTYGCHPV